MRRRLSASSLVCLLAVSGCGEDGTVVPTAAEGGSAAVIPVSDAGAPGPEASALDASDGSTDVEARVTALLAQMTLAEKAGQMTMGGWTSLASTDDITTYGLGALGGAPADLLPSDWLTLTATARAKVAATRLGIPIIFAIDAVHGNAKVRATTVFPHNIGMGCTRDADLVRQAAVVNAAEVTALGLALAEAPDVDVGRDERWGRSYESFGEDPDLVSMMATAAFTGYRGNVLASAKHFLGAGGTAWGTGVGGRIDQGNVLVDEGEMRRVHLPPFAAAVAAGAQVVMVGPDVRSDVLLALAAGIDLVNVAGPYAQVVAAIESLVTSGAVPESRIDQSVRRILRVKMRAGLFDAAPPDPSAVAAIGSPAHRAVARQAVRESMVLLQNDAALLPLPKGARVHVAGPGAADLGIQSGGWTLGWQGLTGVDSTAMGGGTTLVDALRAAATSPDLVTYSTDGTGAAGADVGVLVLHELPYAEYEGDTPDPRFDSTASPNIYDGTAAGLVANMTAAHVPLVLVLVTGRPVRIESLLPSFGAVVAAWLPGSEGGGVADVLYGDASFTGKLARSWPKDTTVLPIAYDQTPYDPLYAYGYGLTY